MQLPRGPNSENAVLELVHSEVGRIEDAGGLDDHPSTIPMVHMLVGWDKEAAIWWAGACEPSLPLRLDVVLGKCAVSAGPPRTYARWFHPT